MVLPYFFSVKEDLPVIDPALTAFINTQKLPALQADSTKADKKTSYFPPEKKTIEKPSLFPFDPNTISIEGWIGLGLAEKTAKTIINYRNKGGKFRKREDIRKIWGLPKALADQLVPYVQLPEPAVARFYKADSVLLGAAKHDQPEKKKAAMPIDINTASPGEWKTLPGIGEVLANRVVHYRERIGGFTSVEQVKKVYGLSDSLFQQLVPFLKANPVILKKLNLNAVSQHELSRRTGISAEVARAIIVYRQQYGPYQSVHDLRKIVFITDSLFNKILPQVQVE
jgi:competence ComEA-like helix-hairpin-helix protein